MEATHGDSQYSQVLNRTSHNAAAFLLCLAQPLRVDARVVRRAQPRGAEAGPQLGDVLAAPAVEGVDEDEEEGDDRRRPSPLEAAMALMLESMATGGPN